MTENEREFLMFYMEQTWEEMRHIETLRERLTIIVVTIATATVGFVMQQKYALETYPLAYFVIALGIFGYLGSLKLFQIHQMGQRRLEKWYRHLLGNETEPMILQIRDEADKENSEKFPIISTVRHNYLWATIHILIVMAGIFLVRKY